MDAERTSQIARLLAASEQAREHGTASAVNYEAVSLDAVPQRPRDILDLADANLSRPSEVDPGDWNTARELLLTHAGGALSKLANNEQELAADEGGAMEALIISDGTRPSFLLCNSSVDPNDPFIGAWGASVTAAEAVGMSRLAAAVGRIQPQHGHGSNFVGTGSLIDRDKGLILTNHHVIRMAEQVFGVAMTRTDRRIRIDGHLEIDFAGESCSLTTSCFRIVEVLLPEGYGDSFAGFDVAVARIDTGQGDHSLPSAVRHLSADPAYATGSMESLALVGFPAAPSIRDGENVDWNFVIRTLFANQFGVKRLAPGRFSRPLGSHPDDAGFRRAIGHDATTFGGASGSLVAAWLDNATPCFAIHFGGATGSSNYALAFAAAHQVLTPLGVEF